MINNKKILIAFSKAVGDANNGTYHFECVLVTNDHVHVLVKTKIIARKSAIYFSSNEEWKHFISQKTSGGKYIIERPFLQEGVEKLLHCLIREDLQKLNSLPLCKGSGDKKEVRRHSSYEIGQLFHTISEITDIYLEGTYKIGYGNIITEYEYIDMERESIEKKAETMLNFLLKTDDIAEQRQLVHKFHAMLEKHYETLSDKFTENELDTIISYVSLKS